MGGAPNLELFCVERKCWRCCRILNIMIYEQDIFINLYFHVHPARKKNLYCVLVLQSILVLYLQFNSLAVHQGPLRQQPPLNPLQRLGG